MKTARFLVLGGALALGGAAAFLTSPGESSRISEIANVPLAERDIGTMSLAVRSTLNSGAIDCEGNFAARFDVGSNT